ncbi:hypothetical protein [Chryseobacterium sp.]|uniref:hypothetical protein n=1 Tax=Chryseobacterium sp. TaxID=1871047 RepID=UPI0025C2AF65|nr:hypothetical protein [Chryseobacterium sp.]MBV8325976.1 hypothetical protein [Chryseobacterium sp.]
MNEKKMYTALKGIIVLLFAGCTVLCNAQILDEYPKNQEFYEGGSVNFYKEAHEYLVSNNLKECDAGEIYQPRIIVTEEKGIKFIKDTDTANIAKNKCAYDLSRLLIQNLKNWKPAEVNKRKIGAVTEFIFYPKDIMSNYKPGYNASHFVKYAQYPEGVKKFKNLFHDNFMMIFQDYAVQGNINLEFYIDKNGQIANPRIYPEIDNRSFNIDFMRTLARMKKPWKPALYGEIPIKERISFPLNFSVIYTEY